MDHSPAGVPFGVSLRWGSGAQTGCTGAHTLPRIELHGCPGGHQGPLGPPPGRSAPSPHPAGPLRPVV